MKKKWFLTVLMIVITIVGLKAQKSMCSSVPLTIATYNLRYDNPEDGENAWPNRKEKVKALIQFHSFDLFGTQEGLSGMLTDLSKMKEYGWIGRGRDDGKDGGEYSAIFYRKDRFKLLQEGDFWLSETPGEPSYGWDAGIRRICSWAKFRDLKTSKEFFFFSVHFDHRGVEARKESGKLMVRKIREIAGDFPVFCVGDLNSTPETEQIKTIKTLLKDSREITVMPPYGPEGTFNGFRFDSSMNNRIDYIFVNDKIKVLKYAVLTDSYDCKFPSDHFPVMTKVVIN